MAILTASFCFLILLTSCLAMDESNYYTTRLNIERLQYKLENLSLPAVTKLDKELNKVINMATILNSLKDDSIGDITPGEPFTMNTTVTTPALPKISPQCWNDTKTLFQGMTQAKGWALNMIDSVGKPPSGILNGHMTWLGNYAECIGATTDTFIGKYCLQTFWLSSVSNPITRQKGLAMKSGLCVPDSCSSEDVKNMLNLVVPKLSNNSVYASDGDCQELNHPYDTRAVIALTVISIFIGIITIATAYDINRRHMQKAKTYDLENEANSKGKGEINVSYISDDKITDANSEIKYKIKELVEASTITKSLKPGTLGKLLLSFSVYTNSEKILSTHQVAGALTAVNGLRFISMTWVILGHTFAFGLSQVVNLAEVYGTFIKRKSFMAIINAEVSVDSFFALSGLLLTYLVLTQMKKQKGKLNWFMFYFHRFWRLTPPYMLVMLVYLSLFGYLGSGPFWKKEGFEKDHCRSSWWYNLLYINNFRKGSEECFAWAWYLANDMQFFVISPLIIIPMYRSTLAGHLITAAFLLGTIIASGVVSKQFKLHARIDGEYFDQYYQMPYCRMGPYLIGMYTGFLLYILKCKCTINKYLNLLLWASFAAAASAVLYGVYNENNGKEMSVDMAALYNAVHKTVWGAAVCWVIFACATGNGGFINTLLSWKPFIPLGRLTYCAYLVHPIVMYYYYSSRKYLLYWDDHAIIYLYLGNLGISYACAFITSLAFEAPMMGLEKVIFKR